MNKQIKKEIQVGIKVESEHKGTLSFIKNYYKQHKQFPSDKTVYKHISSDHVLKEDPNYYKKLKKAGL